MVRNDCESSDAPSYLQILHNSHVHANTLLGQDLDSGLIQFSDSIVFSKPFDLNSLHSFIETIGSWQKFLILQGLLCRGGITFGKHFVKDRFLFSKAMIDAYNLEKSRARFPRIVISEDLLELASTSIDINSMKICKEDDGEYFIHYLLPDTEVEKEKIVNSIESFSRKINGMATSVKEKIRWLLRYADHALGTSFASPQFVDLQ
jgi:hypothetical protein